MNNENTELQRSYERGFADGMAAESIARTKKYPIAFTHEEYNAVIEAALADEREACAQVCQEAYLSQRSALIAAGLIRARGQE